MAGSILPDYSPSVPTDYDWPVPDRLIDSAEQFLTLFHQENNLGSPDHRIRQVRREIEFSGSYWHTPAELAFGARVAWRNSSRCIGRLYWHSLRVRDRREISSAADIAAESVTHLRTATNDGRIRPLITVFAPDAPGQPGPRIISSQLIRYAGYDLVGGGVVGDPANVDLTRLARELGWTGGRPPGRFDILPLLVQEAGAPVTMHEIPRDAVLEVGIEHPEYRWFANLGLRWYAVPVISSMYLDIGGVRYPAAPFNGWYMGTEIGSRDFGDAGRYDQLREIAAHLGLSTATDRNLWKDKALTELNLAVLHSFDAGRRHDHRPSHRVGPLPPAPAAGGAARPGLPSGLVLDRASRRVLGHAGLPPHLRRLRPDAELLPPPGPGARSAPADSAPVGSPRAPAPANSAHPVPARAVPPRADDAHPSHAHPGLAHLLFAQPFLAHAGLAQPARASAARGGAGRAVPPSVRGTCPAPPDD